MIKCVECGTENFEQSQYCDECGARFDKSKRNSLTDIDLNQTFLENNQSNEVPAFAVEPAVSSASVLKESGGGTAATMNVSTDGIKSISAKIVIERGKSAGKEFFIERDETSIGRWDADNGIFPDVDLDPDDPEAKVSRRHARIVRRNGQFALEDLGSTNGTFVNRGRRLLPGNAQFLNDGDEIIVGKTFLRFQIVH
jgi:hypothetical protein